MTEETIHDMPGSTDEARSAPGSKFQEAWQATAYVVAIKLSEMGYFTWSEWTHALGRELRAHHDGETSTYHEHYYDLWQNALEALLVEKGVITDPHVAERAAMWRRAYELTPHGSPVELAAAMMSAGSHD
ncbi:nitrile hydratase accessory protein [Rhizobium sp. Root1204]|uniref:nitrile hydratase accessory protein n=1 Tax=Rhizobium sp. Root1204 TaxID=1736428 RepID=UPI00138F3AF7|nr:nitrile hydratase accessory protein [Rhizobium sp. Root1204]